MTQYASYAGRAVRGILVSVVALVVTPGGCKPSANEMPSLAKGIPSLKAPPKANSKEGLKYRKSGGHAISPVVVGDDPVPSAAPTAAVGNSGSSGTLNGHPGGITRETLNRSIQGAMGSLASCFTNLTNDPMVAVSFEAEPSGRPSLVRVKGAPPDAERCIRSVVQGLRFPGFEGKGVQVDLPLSFHRVSRPAQPAAASGQQGEQSPPLFLEP